MKIRIILVGKTKEPFLQSGEQQFLKRLAHYCHTELTIVRAEKLTPNGNEQLLKHKEAERIISHIRSADLVVALDERGDQMSSPELAAFLQEKMNRGIGEIAFVIGGTLGLADSVLKSADVVWSLSKLTFTHEMARLILLEQLYRAFTMIKGTKYHKA